jgi:hypothetical protein
VPLYRWVAITRLPRVWEVQEVLDGNEWVIDRHPSYPEQARGIGFTQSGRWLTVAMDPHAVAGCVAAGHRLGDYR